MLLRFNLTRIIMALSGPHGKMHRSWLEGVVDYIKVRARLKWELQPADARDLALELAGEFTRNPPEAKSSGLSGSIEIVAYVRRCVDNRMLDRRKEEAEAGGDRAGRAQGCCRGIRGSGVELTMQ